MDVLFPTRHPRRLARRVALLATAATIAMAVDAAPRFDVRASLSSQAIAEANHGFSVHAKLSPLRAVAEGGGYSVDAAAVPVGICGSGTDLIFANGFEVPGQ